VLAVAPAAGFSGAAALAPLRGAALRPRSRQGRFCPPGGLGLRASLNDPVEGGADGSLEKLLGNVGLGKLGKGIDWFFDTSTISGAKAWRLQEIPGEADSVRFRGETSGSELEEQLQDQIASRTLQREEVAAMVQADGDYYSDNALDQEYSLEDADLSSSLTARLQQISYQETGMDDQVALSPPLCLSLSSCLSTHVLCIYIIHVYYIYIIHVYCIYIMHVLRDACDPRMDR